jgi:hypothetical protein
MAATAQQVDIDIDSTPEGVGLSVSDIRLDWLPSMPITRKRQAPPVSCIAFFYSEATGRIFHLFETCQLRESLMRYSRHQAAALGQDPDSRVGWLALAPGAHRSQLLRQLIERYQG